MGSHWGRWEAKLPLPPDDDKETLKFLSEHLWLKKVKKKKCVRHSKCNHAVKSEQAVSDVAQKVSMGAAYEHMAEDTASQAEK